ncbi:MAG: GNAT family N-acetyltransferase [Tepidisphaeraceae bacterium]
MSTSQFMAPKGGGIICRRANPGEIPAAVGMILGSPGQPAPAAQVAEFINSSPQRRIDVQGIWVAEGKASAAETSGRLIWAVLPILNPGKTLLLLTSFRMDDSVVPAVSRLVAEICGHFARQGVQLAQVLLEPQHDSARRLFATAGFIDIAELIYLQGQVPRHAKSAAVPQGMRWLDYSAETHGLFAEAILQTYRDSLDCPALSGLRDIEDVISGHQATGQFDPTLWRLLLQDDRPMGVLLLSGIPQSDGTELVYLGVVPEARGRGLGTILMRHAMELTLREHKRRLSLAVDSRNGPALKLYYRFGMQQVATRWAMIRDLRV